MNYIEYGNVGLNIKAQNDILQYLQKTTNVTFALEDIQKWLSMRNPNTGVPDGVLVVYYDSDDTIKYKVTSDIGNIGIRVHPDHAKAKWPFIHVIPTTDIFCRTNTNNEKTARLQQQREAGSSSLPDVVKVDSIKQKGRVSKGAQV